MVHPINNIFKNFILGFSAPFTSIGFILKSPKVMALVIIPLLINIVLYILFFKYGSAWLSFHLLSWGNAIVVQLPTWLGWFSGVILFFTKILSWIILTIIAAFTFTIVGSLIASPFNDILSHQVEKSYLRHVTVQSLEKEKQIKLSMFEVIGLEGKRMGILILGAVVIFVINFLPLMQLPALILGALLLSFEYFGYPISRRSKNLNVVWGFVLKNPVVSFGFGCSLLLLMLIPFASLVYLPLAVVSGSILYQKVKT